MGNTFSDIKYDQWVTSVQQIDSDQVLVTGNTFIKLYSISSGKELAGRNNASRNFKPDILGNQLVYLPTSDGLITYVLPDLEIRQIVMPGAMTYFAKILYNLNSVLFMNKEELHLFEIESCNVTNLQSVHQGWIGCAEVSSDQTFFFTTDFTNNIFKWETKSQKMKSSLSLSDRASCLLICEDLGLVLVGLVSGVIDMVAIQDFFVYSSMPTHSSRVTRIIQPFSNCLISCSEDQSVLRHYLPNTPLTVLNSCINDITLVNNTHLFCACDDGLYLFPEYFDPFEIMFNSISTKLNLIKSSNGPLTQYALSLLLSDSFNEKKTLMFKDLIKPAISRFLPKTRYWNISIGSEFQELYIQLQNDREELFRIKTYCKNYSVVSLSANDRLYSRRVLVKLFKSKTKFIARVHPESKLLLNNFVVDEVQKNNLVYKTNPSTKIVNGDVEQ